MSTGAVVLGIFLGLVVPVLAASVPVLMGIRVTILDAVTDRGIDARYGYGPLPRLIEKLPVPITVRMAVSNIARKKERLALTIVTLSLAAGAFMGVFAVISAFSAVVDSLYGSFGNQISVNPADVQRSDAVLQTLRAEVPGLSAIEPGVSLAIEIEGYTPESVGGTPPILFGLGINPANTDLVRFDLLAGTGWRDDPTRQGVIITGGIAYDIGKTSGDTIRIRVGSHHHDFEIIGVANSPFDIVWFQWETLAEVGGVTGGAPTPNQYTTTVQIDGEDVLASGISEEAQAFLIFYEGQPLSATESDIIVTNALAQAGNYAIGDTLTVRSGENSEDFRISGVFDVPPEFRDDDTPEEGIGMFWQDLAQLQGLSLAGNALPNTYSIIMDADDPSAEAVDEKISEINETLLQNGITATYINWVRSADLTAEVILTAAVVLNTAAFLIGAVGAIGLLTTLSMSVFERQKEIGVMRSIGASSQSIAAQFLTEGLIVGTMAWLIGVPLSYGLFHALIVAFNFGDMVGLEYSLGTVVVGLVGTLTLAAISSISPALTASRKTVSDILRYQ
jgi:ABC-type lipoprotein release transport system permease subunit